MINFNGYGGKENEYIEFCKTQLNLKLTRISAKKYDFIDEYSNKIELKKQKDLQWLNALSYVDLTNEDKKIKLHVLLKNDDGSVASIHECLLGDFISTIYDDVFLNQVKETFKNTKVNHQIKTPVHMKKHIKEYNRIYKKIF